MKERLGRVFRTVTFNLDPPRIGFPGTNFSEIFGPIYSENFVPTVDQPQEGKSVHVNGHEVTIKDIV